MQPDIGMAARGVGRKVDSKQRKLWVMVQFEKTHLDPFCRKKWQSDFALVSLFWMIKFKAATFANLLTQLEILQGFCRTYDDADTRCSQSLFDADTGKIILGIEHACKELELSV